MSFALHPAPHGPDVLVPIPSENVPNIDNSASDSNEENIGKYELTIAVHQIF